MSRFPKYIPVDLAQRFRTSCVLIIHSTLICSQCKPRQQLSCLKRRKSPLRGCQSPEGNESSCVLLPHLTKASQTSHFLFPFKSCRKYFFAVEMLLAIGFPNDLYTKNQGDSWSSGSRNAPALTPTCWVCCLWIALTLGTGLSLEEEDCCRDRLPFCTGSATSAADATDMLPVLRKEALCGRDGGALARAPNPAWSIFRIWACPVLFCRGRARGMCLSGIVCRLEKSSL